MLADLALPSQRSSLPFQQSKLAVGIYRFIYVAFVFIGAIAEINTVWLIADCFNALMALPNLIALIGLAGLVVKINREHFAQKS